ncbi:MAG: hypothetical protein CM1200mP9_11250 [Gammaproteobacteria bacterium]|nr:MAG: hypothetical protein CM1200mP9_11250 [Gammaproteobacteria bacterium]
MNAVEIMLGKAESLSAVLEARALVAEHAGKIPEETFVSFRQKACSTSLSPPRLVVRN